MVKTVKLDVLRTVASICKFGSLKLNIQNKTKHPGHENGLLKRGDAVALVRSQHGTAAGSLPIPLPAHSGTGQRTARSEAESS